MPILLGSNGVPYIPTMYLNRLRAQVKIAYNDQGRAYQTQTFSVDPTNGTVSATALVASAWYDHRGNLIKTASPGGPVTKTQYDGVGRPVVQYVTDGSGDMTWSDAGSVANNNVLSQVETTYDKDGNVILTTDRERFHNEFTTGALMNPANSPKARVSYQAAWYDAADRLIATADPGTNNGQPYSRPPIPPTGSTDTLLVTLTTYNAAGWVDTMIDPRGLVSKTLYDNLGRTTKSVAAYTGGPPGDSTDQTTEYTYDGDNHVTLVQADLGSGQTEQTQYVYGVNSSTISSFDLLGSVVYPANGHPNTATYAYNALGDVTNYTDRNGTSHAYTYDVLGREISDTATITSAFVDSSVQRLDTAYDTQGNPYLFTSYADAAGTTIVNQVQRSFNGLGQLTTETQAHGARQGTVQYTYSNMQDGQGHYANHSRPTGIVYPRRRTISYSYGIAGGVDDLISREDALVDQGGTGPTLEALTYLGLDTVVQRSHPEANLTLSYINVPGGSTDGGDQYTGLDRFGRVIDQYWSAGSTATDDFRYTYDHDSNPLTRSNALNSAFSEQYGYDNLNRLTGFQRGTHQQGWTLDALGNWVSFTNDTMPPQTRTHNAQNQITQFNGQPVQWYDNDGNTTTDDQGDAFVYDAWNRLVKVTAAGGATYVYSYDALGRRITAQVNGGQVTDLYYSSSWQVIEEQVGGVMTAQFVWSPVYVDALVERDTAAGPRLYAQQDADWNVTALVDTTGTPKERYAYDPYGKTTVLDPMTWAVHGSGMYGTSSFSWVYLHHGGRYERYSDAAGMYLFRHRDYSPTLGRWLEQDPAGYSGGGANLYEYAGSGPVANLDPSGLGVLDQIKEVIDVGGDIAALDTKWVLGKFGVNVDVEVQSNFFRNITPDTVQRASGALQAIGGAGEATIGLSLFEIPFVGPVATGVFGSHGADNFSTGMDRLLYGEPSQTYTAQTLGPEVDQAINDAATVIGITIGVAEFVRPTPVDFGGGGAGGGGAGGGGAGGAGGAAGAGDACRPLIPEEPVTPLPPIEEPILPSLPEPVDPLPPPPVEGPVMPPPVEEPIPPSSMIEAPRTGPLTTLEDVAAHIQKNGRLPANFITKAEARRLGWNPSMGNLNEVAPGMSIGGDVFRNLEGRLPTANGRVWYEADINYSSGFRGNERILYSNDGLIYSTNDHYTTFTRIK